MIIITFTILVVCLLAAAFFYFKKKKTAKKSAPLTLDLVESEGLSQKLSAIFSRSNSMGELVSELETTLISADVGLDVTAHLIKALGTASSPSEVRNILRTNMEGIFTSIADEDISDTKPHVIAVFGVNGVGKTTTIAKLAHRYISENKKVLLVAADTYRAAAAEQLKVWASRLGVDIVAQKEGADPASVAFDGVTKAVAKNYDVVIIDTAGRLHTKQNLMEELEKVVRVIGKALSGAPHEKFIVIDATVGTNGLVQARKFDEAVGLTGGIVAKLDGTAKGGVVFALASEIGLPIKFIGVGEKMEDLKKFNAKEFVESIILP